MKLGSLRRIAMWSVLLAFLAGTAVQAAEITSRVEVVGGAPTLPIDGKPHPGASYMTYVGIGDAANPKPLLGQYVAEVAKSGCDLFTFVTDLGGVYGYTPTVWPAPDRFDFSYLDAMAHVILAAGGPHAKLMLQLYVDAPLWWCDQHPNELMVLSDGKTGYNEKLFALPRADKFPSIASEVWRADMKRAIDALIDHVQQSDYGARVAGYQVCGQKTEEWYHWSMNNPELGDYSAPMLRAWRAWLRAKYGTDAELQKAWSRADATLDSAVIPTKAERYGDSKATFRDPVKDANVIDFHRFWSDVMADTIAYFAKVVKEKTGHSKVVGAFYAYSFEFAELAEDAGHLALSKLCECPDLDFIMSPGSYQRRNLKGGQSCFRTPLLSLRLHGKLFWNDFDAASFKIKDKDQKELAPWLEQLAATDTAEEFTWMMRRELGNALASGVNMAWFDLHGGYYDDPTILADLGKQREVRVDALQQDRRSIAEILVVFDEDSMHYLGFRNPMVRKSLIEQLVELPFVAPYDSVLLSDLDRVNVAQYKLVIVANAYKLDTAQREVLKRKILRDHKQVVWLYAPGYFAGADQAGGVEHVGALTGIHIRRVTPSPTAEPATLNLMDGSTVEIPVLQGEQFQIAPEVSAGGTSTTAPNGASKDMGDWRSIYWNRAPLPAAYLRELATAAGVHLYHDDPKDQVYASGSYVTLAAGAKAGPRTLRLRETATVRDAYTGVTLATGAKAFEADFKSSEVRMFKLEKNPVVKKDWYTRATIGMEVGPTGAQFGVDPTDAGYAAKFSGKDIVEQQIKIGSDYVVVWARDGEFVHYNSKFAPKAPGMGDRDVLREAVDAAKPYNLPVLAYCVVQASGYMMRQHPEWQMVGSDGKTIGRMCLNSPYIQHIKDLTEEMLAYGLDGFHIDMLDQGFGPPIGCWCDTCKAKFRAEYGMDMPAGVTWDAAWDKMLEFRYATSVRFEQELLAHIHKLNPKVSVDFNYHGNPPFSWEVGQRPVQHARVGDFATGESGIWGFSALFTGLEAEFLRASDPAKVFQVVLQRGVRFYHDQTTRPLNDMRWEAMNLLAHGALVTIVDKTPYDGTMDPLGYERMGAIIAEAKAKREQFKQPPLYEAGIYYSARSRDWYGRDNAAKYQLAIYGAQKALVYEHIPWGIVLDENVSAEGLRRFPVVVLSNATILSPREVELLKAYVNDGGNLVVTGATGTYGPLGEALDHSTMEELIGAKFVERLGANDNHVRVPATAPANLNGLSADLPAGMSFMVYGPAVVYSPTSAKPFGELIKPHRTLRQRNGKEGFDFPMSPDAPVGPAVLLNEFGKGKVVTIAASPDYAIASEYGMPEARLLLRNALRYLRPAPEIRIDAPINVEAVVTDDPTSRTVRVHLLGYLIPPGSIPYKDRPFALPSLIEEAPHYKAAITLKRPVLSAEKFGDGHPLQVNGQTVEISGADIHEVVLLRY